MAVDFWVFFGCCIVGLEQQWVLLPSVASDVETAEKCLENGGKKEKLRVGK